MGRHSSSPHALARIENIRAQRSCCAPTKVAFCVRVTAPTIRIFSDLHFLEQACRIKTIEQLRPLLDGTDEIVFNGDLIDTQTVDPDHSIARELKAYFSSHAPTTFITGNHDPDLSDTHELSLANDSIWLTHGDVFFEDLVPWSRDQPEIRRRLRKAWANTPVQEQTKPEVRLHTFRQICLGLHQGYDPCKSGLGPNLRRYLSLLYPPRCSLALLHAWATTSRRAAQVARQHRAQAKFIIFGHTHRPGAWPQRDGRVVINTGSFCGPLTGQAVELHGGELRLRPIAVRGAEFRLLPPTKTFALPAPALTVLSAQS